jgi:hypothetical protein
MRRRALYEKDALIERILEMLDEFEARESASGKSS